MICRYVIQTVSHVFDGINLTASSELEREKKNINRTEKRDVVVMSRFSKDDQLTLPSPPLKFFHSSSLG